MNKAIISVITLVVFISLTGYATERYEANMRERQAGTGTPTMIKKQEAVSISQNSNNLYPSSYRLFFANTDPPSMKKQEAISTSQDRNNLYPSSYRILFPNTKLPAMMKKQGVASTSQDSNKLYPSSYRLLFPN